MRVQKMSVKVLLVAFAFAALGAVSASADEYSFKVTNNTGQVIKKLLASEDGAKYGAFDIGAGIKPGATVTLVWDQSTDGESCSQHFKAVYADGSESEAAEFDFCEADVALEFDE